MVPEPLHIPLAMKGTSVKSLVTPKAAVSSSEPQIEQQTLLTSFVLHLFPSLCVLIGSLIATPLVVQAGFPAELGLLLSSLLLGVSLRLGYLFYQAKKHQGTFSLRGIVLYWGLRYAKPLIRSVPRQRSVQGALKTGS